MAESLQTGGRLLVVFDGHCGLCNQAVRWFLIRDRWDRLRFVDSESPKVAGLLTREGFRAGSADLRPSTILVVRQPEGQEEILLVRSQAVLALLGELPRPWPAVGYLLGWIPRVLRDLGYQLIARWRYRIWGRLECCPIPTAAERAKFL